MKKLFDFVLSVLFLLAVVVISEATVQRSAKVPAAYRKIFACPATGKMTGPCPGYVLDHAWPLCAGGPDEVTNMAWMQADRAKIKDKWEMGLCKK